MPKEFLRVLVDSIFCRKDSFPMSPLRWRLVNYSRWSSPSKPLRMVNQPKNIVLLLTLILFYYHLCIFLLLCIFASSSNWVCASILLHCTEPHSFWIKNPSKHTSFAPLQTQSTGTNQTSLDFCQIGIFYLLFHHHHYIKSFSLKKKFR